MRKRITEEEVREMIRLRRQGKSISAIARAVGCHRKTVRDRLAGRQGDILTDEVKKQLLADVLEKHFNDLTEFAVSYKSYFGIPSWPTEDKDAAAVFEPLLGKELPQGLDSDSLQARRQQRQMNRRNRMLLMSLREHTRGQGWWQAVDEWQQAWNACRDAFGELRGEADEVVRNRIDQKSGPKEEVKRRISKGKDEVGTIVSDVLWLVWGACARGKPVEKFQFEAEQGRVVAYFADATYFPLGHRLSEDSLGPDMAEVCKLSYETLCQSFIDKGIPEMLDRIDKKIEVIDDALDPFVLRPLLVRTRCELCPV